MHYLSSVYFVNEPLHVSGIFVAHHQEVYCVYIYICNNWYMLCTTRTNCCVCVCLCVYMVYLMMMGYKYARNM